MRRAAAAAATIDQHLLPAGPTAVNPQQRRTSGTDGRTDGQTDRDGWKPDSCIDLAPHIMRAVPQKHCVIKLVRTRQHHRFNFILRKATNSHYFSHTAANFTKMMFMAFFCQFSNFCDFV